MPTHPSTHGRLSPFVAIPLAMFIGALTATQTRINGELGRQLGDGYTAATISFGSGLIILSLLIAFSPKGRTGFRNVVDGLRERSFPWWSVTGGLAGAFFVFSQGITGAIVGVALFTVAIVAGQTVAGLVFDRIGLGPRGHVPLTWPRALGALLALAAVVWAVSARVTDSIPIWMLVMPLIAGCGTAWQQGVNGRVRARAHSALTATFINFVVGTTALLIMNLIHASIAGWPKTVPTEPWLYVGGAIGCVFIAVSAYLVQHTGVLVLGLGVVAGQLLMALVLDLMLPAGVAVQWTTIAGTVLALIAVAVASIRVGPRTA